jgi:hemerythrin-like domain-containing protein
MTMNRVIHGAVRRDLARLDAALLAFPDGDADRAQGLARAFANLHTQLTHHHEGEDAHVWPMLAGVGVDSGLLETMESEHEAMSAALAETDAAMGTFARNASAADAAAARESLLRTRAVVDQHLDHEESDLEPQLQKHLDSPEWKAVEKKLRAGSPAEAGAFFAWLTDGMDNPERSYLRSAVPAPVVFLLTRVLGRSYNKEVAPVWRTA